MLEEGRIFRLESPTHIVIKGNKNHYFFSNEEFQGRSVDGSVVLIKGLGEMRADQMRESMFGVDQRLVPFKWSKENDIFLRSLMGSEVEPRKEYLFNSVDFSKITE